MVRPTRREVLAVGAAAALLPSPARAAVPDLPELIVAAGDVGKRNAVIWARSSRPGKLRVEVAASARFSFPRIFEGDIASAGTDGTARVRVEGLPVGREVHYRARIETSEGPRPEPVTGRFMTGGGPTVRFAFGGDTCGQGFGLNPEFGGFRIFEAIHRAAPDLFVHAGDYIYADGPIREELPLPDGRTWRNLVTDDVTQVAQTLDQYRARYRYNLLDEHLRRLLSETGFSPQWNDHEVLNNWWPGQVSNRRDYDQHDVDVLTRRARQAFMEYQPVTGPTIYRKIRRGPHCDLFLLDTRSYRGRNSRGEQTSISAATAWLGHAQASWLRDALRTSTATWKFISCDMPLGIASPDAGGAFDNAVNGNGAPTGRELEIARLLSGIKADGVKNIVWLTADLHYAAATHYDPSRARFGDFDPFWEFLAGPLHAGSFVPQALDDTFGPEMRYCSVPEGMTNGASPYDGHQYFGVVDVLENAHVVVTLRDQDGATVYTHEMDPAPPAS